jgi:hypothetical protein
MHDGSIWDAHVLTQEGATSQDLFGDVLAHLSYVPGKTKILGQYDLVRQSPNSELLLYIWNQPDEWEMIALCCRGLGFNAPMTW